MVDSYLHLAHILAGPLEVLRLEVDLCFASVCHMLRARSQAREDLRVGMVVGLNSGDTSDAGLDCRFEVVDSDFLDTFLKYNRQVKKENFS